MSAQICQIHPRIFYLIVMLAIPLEVSAEEVKWESLMSVIGTTREAGAIAGNWKKIGNELVVDAATGGRIAIPVTPPVEYDFRISFTRKSGRHSIGMILVQGGRSAAFELDAWGKHLAGFQNLNGHSIEHNPTRTENVLLENGRKYSLTLQVRRDGLRALLDNREICQYRTDGHDLSVSEFWQMPKSGVLGLVAWESETVFHSVELRSVSGNLKLPDAIAPTVPMTVKKAVANNSSTVNAKPDKRTLNPGEFANRDISAKKEIQPSKTSSSNTDGEKSLHGDKTAVRTQKKRVLIVIANFHFFFREYADPREELEAAGIAVTVAAGRKGNCIPHDGSGQGNRDGIVQADLALKNVRATDYDALLFSGGWGASAYQFGFNGRYDELTYNGERAIKTEVNRLINEFISQDKYVCALCNGVSVLAWARVNGKSPLHAKQICAPVREAPSGIYNGRPGQPSCRWHPEVNGAKLSPPGSIGRPGNAIDDVLVDGKIITGEDDISAREMGRRIVAVLKSNSED